MITGELRNRNGKLRTDFRTGRRLVLLEELDRTSTWLAGLPRVKNHSICMAKFGLKILVSAVRFCHWAPYKTTSYKIVFYNPCVMRYELRTPVLWRSVLATCVIHPSFHPLGMRVAHAVHR